MKSSNTFFNKDLGNVRSVKGIMVISQAIVKEERSHKTQKEQTVRCLLFSVLLVWSSPVKVDTEKSRVRG